MRRGRAISQSGSTRNFFLLAVADAPGHRLRSSWMLASIFISVHIEIPLQERSSSLFHGSELIKRDDDLQCGLFIGTKGFFIRSTADR